jgi:hypothetical protein
MNTYTIDLSLQPTTFDLWHVCLFGTVLVLALTLIVLLIGMVIGLNRRKPEIVVPAEPVVKIVEVEKIVEKIVQAPTPEPVVLKEATPDAALQLLGLLQKEARFIDFIEEDIAAYSDADIGIAARVVHEGCHKAIKEHFSFAPVRSEAEGNKITLQQGFDASSIRLTGHIVGTAPFTGTLIHKGWQVTHVNLPKLTQGHNAAIIAAAEVEL